MDSIVLSAIVAGITSIVVTALAQWLTKKQQLDVEALRNRLQKEIEEEKDRRDSRVLTRERIRAAVQAIQRYRDRLRIIASANELKMDADQTISELRDLCDVATNTYSDQGALMFGDDVDAERAFHRAKNVIMAATLRIASESGQRDGLLEISPDLELYIEKCRRDLGDLKNDIRVGLLS